MNSERRKRDMISLAFDGPSSRIELTTTAGMGGERDGGAVTVWKDGSDGAVLCCSEYGTTVGTNSQNEDWNKEGGDWYVQFLSGLSLFAVVLFLRVSLWFPDVCSGLPSLGVLCFSSFSGSFLVAPFLISEDADTLSF